MRKAYEAITNFIFMEDTLEKADVILIPGGSHYELIHRAVEIYKQGYAKYILISGGANKKIPDYNSECDFLCEEAVKLGIPDSRLLRENKAAHTFDNAEFSYNVLKENKIPVEKAILVCKSFHSRRAYITYKVHFPENIKFIVQPIIDKRDIRKDNWFLSADKTKRVMSEVMKIGKYFEDYIPRLV